MSFLVRSMVWLLGGAANLLRRTMPPPRWISFVISGELPTLTERRRGLLARLTPKRGSLQELERDLDRIRHDRRVRGVVLHLGRLRLSVAERQTLRGMIRRAKDAGKTVIAWASSYDAASFHVACACDKVYLQRGGRIGSLGVAQRYWFLADALGKAGLSADFVQISPYKTASDMVTRTDMSEEARRMADWLADDIFAQLLEEIGEGRKLSPDRARDALDAAMHTDIDAEAAGLVDGLLCEDELPSRLAESAKAKVKIATFRQARRRLLKPLVSLSSRGVGILRIHGDIVDGRSAHPPVRPPFRVPLLLSERSGDLTIVAAARRAATDRRTAAVVVHVDSGGGASTASEAMAAALRSLAARKPVVLSMGAVAASGGYYVATPAQWIIAQPGTLTGSIGVVAGKLVNASLLRRLAFRHEWIDRGDGESLYRGDDAFTDAERKEVLRSIRHVYDLFLDRVAASRKLSADEVDAVGGGRVWTGRQAREHGLVDAFGGLHEAIAKARELASLGSRAPVRDIAPPRGDAAPVPVPASALLQFVADGAASLGDGKALCICPLVVDGR